jgi:hypothetical protein
MECRVSVCLCVCVSCLTTGGGCAETQSTSSFSAVARQGADRVCVRCAVDIVSCLCVCAMCDGRQSVLSVGYFGTAHVVVAARAGRCVVTAVALATINHPPVSARD